MCIVVEASGWYSHSPCNLYFPKDLLVSFTISTNQTIFMMSGLMNFWVLLLQSLNHFMVVGMRMFKSKSFDCCKV